MVAALLALTICTNFTWAGTPAAPAPPAEDLPPVWARYFQLADLVFPRKVLEETPSEFVLTLRVLPAFEGDSQIVISKKLRGGYTVTYYSLPRGSKSVGWQLTEITVESKIEDPVEIAKRIKVDVRDVDVPWSLISGQMDRIAKLQLSPLEELDTGFVTVDATTYQFWLQRVGDPVGFYVCLKGDVYGQKHKAHPLVRWMNEMKALVEKYARPE
jgi:hypothetical protein